MPTPDPLAALVQLSNRIGLDPRLVQPGGGSTSVKLDDTLFVKGSGTDLVIEQGTSAGVLDTLVLDGLNAADITVRGDIQLRTTLAVPSVKSHPNPSPLAQPITAITASDTAVCDPLAIRKALNVPPHRRASAIATKPSASSDGSFTCDDKVISTVPRSSMPIG